MSSNQFISITKSTVPLSTTFPHIGYSPLNIRNGARRLSVTYTSVLSADDGAVHFRFPADFVLVEWLRVRLEVERDCVGVKLVELRLDGRVQPTQFVHAGHFRVGVL